MDKGIRFDYMLQHSFERVWAKLQTLPQADPLELGAFFVILVFIATFLFLIIMSCAHCFFGRKRKHQASRVKPVSR